MSQAVATFFEELQRRPRDPRLAKARGTVRFDVLADGQIEHWLVTLDGGQLHVSSGVRHDANAVVITDAEHLDRTVRGEARAAPAMLRGDLLVRGDWRLLIVMERLLPSPPGTRGPHLRRRRK